MTERRKIELSDRRRAIEAHQRVIAFLTEAKRAAQRDRDAVILQLLKKEIR